MAELRDQHYIEAIKTGDRVVLQTIYQTMMPSLLRLIKPTGGSIDDAKDLFQDAIVLIFKKIQQPDFTLTSAFSTYFYGICRNIWANQLKKKSSGHVTLEEDTKYNVVTDGDWHDLEEQTTRTRIFYRAFRQLGQDCQQLLQLFFQQKTMEEIMQEMQLGSYDYARRRKYLCKGKLTELMKNDPAYQELSR
ncbi:MAG: sigma-70 family RNA polymerase sigma factor [Bacteroidota bacterium]